MSALKFDKKTLILPYTNRIFDALELLMKHIFLFLAILVCSTSAYAQTKKISIAWENDISTPLLRHLLLFLKKIKL